MVKSQRSDKERINWETVKECELLKLLNKLKELITNYKTYIYIYISYIFFDI